MTTRDLLVNEYFRLIAEDDVKIVRLVRSTSPFPSIDAIEPTFAAIERCVQLVPLDWSLLIDVRVGPLRNDPQFEEILARARGRIVSRFARVAVLVQSAVGKLQIARYAREDSKPPRVFDDETAAVSYLTARPALSAKPPKP